MNIKSENAKKHSSKGHRSTTFIKCNQMLIMFSTAQSNFFLFDLIL